jgi:hypothetical protein
LQAFLQPALYRCRVWEGVTGNWSSFGMKTGSNADSQRMEVNFVV